MASKRRQSNIDDIENWVKAELRRIKLQPKRVVLELKRDVSIPHQLVDWQMYVTSGNENDCMIHALLTDCSPTFRIMDIDAKNTIARSYRIGPFLEIVSEYYKKHPEIIVNEDRMSLILVGEPRISFLIKLINRNEFLRQEFLTPICYYYNINVLIYATNRPGEVGRAATASKVIFEFVPETDLIENAPTIVMHNGSSIHFSAMSQKDGTTFIMSYDNVAVIKAEMKALIREEQPDARPECVYKEGDIFTDNGGEKWIVQALQYPTTYGNLNCSSLTIQEFTSREVLNYVPVKFFRKVGEYNLIFDKTAYDNAIKSDKVPSNPPTKPLKPSPQKKSISIPDLLPKSSVSLTPDKELSDYFESGKVKPEFDANTGFAETLGPTRNDPATPKTGLFWEEKIIEIIDTLKKKRQQNLAKNNKNEPIFENYPEFQKLQFDNTGKIVVPSIDEDRIRDYTNGEQEFNKVLKVLQDRVKEIIKLKTDFDKEYLPDSNNLSILSSMLQYPQNSNLENYFLLTDILEETDLNRILNLIAPSVKVNRRNFISLLVLLSKNAKDGYITTNKWKNLYSSLLKVFRETNDKNYADISNIIFDTFKDFFPIIGDSIPFVVNKILSGEEMYKIYQTSYKSDNKNSQFKLSKELIIKRTIAWLILPDLETRTTPTSFIFDKYTEEEKKFMIQENAICKEISELTGKLGKTNIPQMQLPSDFFVKPASGTDKLASFLEETGPNVTKSIQNDRRRMFFKGRGPYVRGGERKTKNIKKMQKKRKTRRKQI